MSSEVGGLSNKPIPSHLWPWQTCCCPDYEPTLRFGAPFTNRRIKCRSHYQNSPQVARCLWTAEPWASHEVPLCLLHFFAFSFSQG